MDDEHDSIIQYFMLNKLAVELLEGAFDQLVYGAFHVKDQSLLLISRITNTIASAPKRAEIMQEMKSRFHFENTKSSAKQITYLKFMDEIIPY